MVVGSIEICSALCAMKCGVNCKYNSAIKIIKAKVFAYINICQEITCRGMRKTGGFIVGSRTYFLPNPSNEDSEIFFDKFSKIGLSFWFMSFFSLTACYCERPRKKKEATLNPPDSWKVTRARFSRKISMDIFAKSLWKGYIGWQEWISF